ncbi:MAG: hypothetical protein WHV64_12160 [Geminicoccaceae bacterium]
MKAVDLVERLTGRHLRHLSVRYCIDRMALMLYERRHSDEPWLTRQAVEILGSWLRPSDVGWEWGSGRSTVWFAKRVQSLVSIEHDESWYKKVGEQLRAEGLDHKVDYRLEKDGVQETSCSRYVRSIDDLHERSLDFVLVDGVCRAFCAQAAIEKIKPGGILVIDNANWFLPGPWLSRSPNSRNDREPATAEWAVVSEMLSSWRCIWTSNGVTDTGLWIRTFE